MKNQIAIVIVYLGKVPNYFSLWLKSVSYNKVDFLLYTDNSLSEYIVPENVKVFQTTFEDIKRKICRTLNDEKIALETPYKLCDYKIIYGDIFNEDLKEYSYWGYGDLDIVWGNMLIELPQEMLEKYDKFFTRAHFCFYKNNEYSRKLYCSEKLKSFFRKDYVIHTNYICHFDELDEWQDVLKSDRKSVYSNVAYADINYRKYSFSLSEEKNAMYSKSPQVYYWQDGKLLQYYVTGERNLSIREVNYIHLQKRKMEIRGELDFTKGILIAPNYFQTFEQKDITAEFVLEMSKRKIVYWGYLKNKLKNYREKIRNGGIAYKIQYGIYKLKGNRK